MGWWELDVVRRAEEAGDVAGGGGEGKVAEGEAGVDGLEVGHGAGSVVSCQ